MRDCPRYAPDSAPLEHFQEKWNPVFRPKMRQCKNARAVSISSQCETALASLKQRSFEDHVGDAEVDHQAGHVHQRGDERR